MTAQQQLTPSTVCDQVANAVAIANMQKYLELHIHSDKENDPVNERFLYNDYENLSSFGCG